MTGVVSGFFANVTDTDRTRCKSAGSLSCYTERIVDRPDRPDSIGYDNLTTTAHRDVDYWGANAEARFGKAPAAVPDRGGYLFRLAYVGLGGDVRGIYQDNELRLRGDNSPVNYSETLDTTYSGAFLSVGGEYNLLGYLGIGSSWGLRSLFSLRGGLYNASTDYDGRFSARRTTTRLGLSDDELAFIGAASLETRKQSGRRTSLSLVTDYEWYSFALKMKYVNADRNGCSEVEDGPLFNCPGTRSIARTFPPTTPSSAHHLEAEYRTRRGRPLRRTDQIAPALRLTSASAGTAASCPRAADL
ncbi:MAG TPA: hypothetical protein VFR71_02335 [Methyloceanibacter sp.]|nr:hypothetical protein [Methyloceanibacter sp.]